MCGIFGYVGPSSPRLRKGKSALNAAKIVFGGLKRLEYRGYDSFGLVVQTPNPKSQTPKLLVEKQVGKISNSNLKSSILNLKSSIALGHTRWATHGGVTEANAHPHLDCSGTIAVVHNGIVENWQELKKSLRKKHNFVSETDTEVIAHMIEEDVKESPLHVAVRKVFNKLSGLNAVVVMARGELVAAKNGSPLVVGVGKSESIISSDATALLPHTNRAIFLRDNQMATIDEKRIKIFDLRSGKQVRPVVAVLDWKIAEADLGKYKHFMLKEIYEQPKVIRNIAENYIDEITSLCNLIKKAHGIFLIGAGTAFHACLAGTYLFSKIAHEHVNTVVASEFNYLEDFLGRKSLIIALSQSGETIDVVEPLKRAKGKGADIAVLVNNVGSTIWQMADFRMELGVGPEIAVASTKAYIAKLAILLLTVYGLTRKLTEGKKLLTRAADEVERILLRENRDFKKIAKVLAKHEHIFTIGRGLSYQTALEAALKIKEISYVHAEGLAAGELKHGPIALISQGTPCIVFAPADETQQAIVSNATEIKARGGLIIGVSPVKNGVFDYWIEVKDLGPASIIANVVPSQLLGYYLALEKGLDPDKPRNLAKSVTVK